MPDNQYFEVKAIVTKFQGWNLDQEGRHVTQVTSSIHYRPWATKGIN